MNNHGAFINMIKQQLRTNDVLDQKILDLYELIPRHEFVPETYAQFAYSDMRIPLAHGQVMLTPVEEGLILQALEFTGQETVLEVGTGTGFFTALLSKLCKKVISIDYFADFTSAAAAKLKAHSCTNVELITGDASQGWVDSAPYNMVIFTGSLPELTLSQRLQVLPGGKLFCILGEAPIMQAWVYSLDHKETWEQKILFESNVPPLIDHSKTKEFIF